MTSLKVSKLVVSALICTTLLAACGGVEDRKEKYLSQAEQSFSEQNYDKAKLGYKNVIQIDPKDIDARMGLAKVQVAMQEWRNAAAQYKGILDIAPDNTSASIELGKLYLLARASDLALEEAESVLSREAENNDAKALKAGVLAQKNKLPEALKILDEVYTSAPDSSDNAILYSSLLIKNSEFYKAISVIDQALTYHPKNTDLYSIQFGIYAQLDKPDLAINNLKKIIKFKQDNFQHKSRLVAYLAKIGRFNAAEKQLQRYIQEDDANMDARKSLVDLLISQKKIDDAALLLNKYIKAYQDDYDFRFGLAKLQLLQKNKASAITILHDIIKRDIDGSASVKAQIETARIYLFSGEVEKAKLLFQSVLAEHPNNSDALLYRGHIAYREKRFDDAINDFRVVLQNDPDDAKVMRSLADSHFMVGDYRLAENFYKQLIVRYPGDLAIKATLADVYNRTGKIESAIQLRNEIQSKALNNVTNLIELAKLYTQVGNSVLLKDTADKLLIDDTSKASGYYFLGLAEQMEGKHQVAISDFDHALSASPKSVEPVSAKIKSMLVLKQSKEAKKWLLSRVEKQKNNALTYNLLGEVDLLDKRYDSARINLEKAIKLENTWAIPYRNLSLSYQLDGKLSKAILILEGAVKVVQKTSHLRRELAGLFEENKQIDDAIAQYEILFGLNKSPSYAANNLAMLLVTYKKDKDSLDRAAQVIESLRGTTNPIFMDTLGWVYYKRAQVDLALPLIKVAAEKAPENAQINYHLALAFNSTDNTNSAIKYLEKALKLKQAFSGRSEAQKLLNNLKGKQS